MGPASDIGVFDGIFDVDLSEIVPYDDLYCDLGPVCRRADPAGNSLLSLQDALLFAGA